MQTSNTDRLETAEIDIAHTGMFGTPRLILPSNLKLQIIKVRSFKDAQISTALPLWRMLTYQQQ